MTVPTQAVSAGPPDLLYGEAETELRSAVRSLLAERAAWADVLARTETAQTYDDELWQTLAAQVGCAGLLIPEELGGAGASYREAAVVAEETGRAVAPVPFLGSAVVATTALLSALTALSAGNDAVVRELLSELAAGRLSGALAVPFAAGPSAVHAATVRVDAPQPGDEADCYRLTGRVAGLADALPAGLLLVPADGVPFGLYAVRASEPGVRMTPVVSLDMTRQLGDLSLDRVPARRLVPGALAEHAISAALLAGAGILASEQVGLAEQCLDTTVRYVQERRQFARPVGSFQAIKHRLADLWVTVTLARAAGRSAAAGLARMFRAEPEVGPAAEAGPGPAREPALGSAADLAAETALSVALAKAACSDAAVKAAQEMVQLHGGIGFTWEHPAHLYLKRAKADSIGYGTADAHRGSLAVLADLPPAGG